MISETPKFVVPAAPGFFTVDVVSVEEKLAMLEPVVAWALDSNNITWAVTVHEVSDDYQAIQSPDGRIHKYEEQWDCLDDMLVELKRAAERDKEKRELAKLV